MTKLRTVEEQADYVTQLEGRATRSRSKLSGVACPECSDELVWWPDEGRQYWDQTLVDAYCHVCGGGRIRIRMPIKEGE